jgi:hypothetical protein
VRLDEEALEAMCAVGGIDPDRICQVPRADAPTGQVVNQVEWSLMVRLRSLLN